MAWLCMLPAEAYSTGICEGAQVGDVQDGQTGETDFLRVDLLPQADRDPDDPSGHEIVSLGPDVLQPQPPSALAKVTVPGFGGRIESVVCIEYRPEMLALVLRNGAEALRNANIRVKVVREGAGTLLFGRLPSLGANETTNLLLSASSSLADAEAITLLIQPSSGQ